MPDKYSFSVADIEAIAASKVNVPGWLAYSWEAVEGGSLIEGCVPGGLFTRGPRKGHPNYQHKNSTHRCKVVVSHEDMNREAVTFEQSTGDCWDCKGSGEVAVSWSAESGWKNGKCKRCSGSGKAPT